MNTPHSPGASPFRQPKAVWAVAFACVVSFMGIGLVDPILPALATKLHATPSSVELLFTSYLVVTAVAMLVTGWVSSRIGGRWTLIGGLVLIVAFSAAAGASHSIAEIIEFRAGWGLGNALFIATSLAVIVGAASGGFAGAIILYETALGLGIALGPLVGGELGGISWRGPFFGVTVLMSISLVATLLFVDQTPRPARRTSILDPLRALRHRGLAVTSFTALCYNWGFFTLLAYTPFIMKLGIHQLGYVFTVWGVLVAIFAVFVAQRLQRRFGTPRTLYVNLFLMAVDLAVIATFTSSKTILIVAVIVSGAFVGLNNTLMTQAVMLTTTVERPVASAAYGFVRFIGGGLAPYCAARLVTRFNVHVPFYLGAAVELVAIGILSRGHALLIAAESDTSEELLNVPSTTEVVAGQGACIVAAIDASDRAPDVIDTAIEYARQRGCVVEILHIAETDVVEELAVDVESMDLARRVINDAVERVEAAGVAGRGHLMKVLSGHAETGRRIAEFAADHQSQLIVIGTPREGALARAFNADLTAQLTSHSTCEVVIATSSSTPVAE